MNLCGQWGVVISASWDDVWIGATPLKIVFNRLYRLSNNQGEGL